MNPSEKQLLDPTLSCDEGRQSSRPLLRWLVGVAVGLVLLHGILAIFWGTGQFVAALAWYVPMMHIFLALAAISVAFLAFSRSRVLHEPTSFWIGMAFTAFAILGLFYVLSWPGLLGNQEGLIARLPNTSGWYYDLMFSALAIFLLIAIFSPWPRAETIWERRWYWLIAALIAITTTVGWLSAAFEQFLPVLVVGTVFTPLFIAWFAINLTAFVAGAALSARRYKQTGDPILSYTAITQITLAFVMFTSIIGGERYDTWWYWRRILMVGGFSVILFGLLSEYVGLFQREREKSLELEALQLVTDPTLARRGLEELLRRLLDRIVSIMNAHAAAILLIDPTEKKLVLREVSGISAKQAAGLRVKVGEDFVGRVVAQNNVLWVRDAQTDPSIWSPYIKQRNIRGIIGAPMRVGEEAIGVLYVDFLEPRVFTPHDERLLEVVAERAALAIQQERLLEESQEERNRLQVLIDTAPVGIVLFSVVDGSRPVLFNKAAEAILGRPLTPDAVISGEISYYGICRPSGEPLRPGETPTDRALRGETCTGVELLVHQPSGRDVYILSNSAPLRDAEGHIVGSVVAFQDITPIKEQERLRDEFLSAAAHELKTPVTTIKGYAQLMRRWAPGGHEPREGRAFEVINAQADRINRRVQEMLEAVRFRTVPPELHRMRFDLGELASQVVQRLQATTDSHQLVLKREAPAPVIADRERIEEVLVSLLNNAIKYSPKGGEIEVRVWVQDEEAIVSVKDQGVGIPKERQPHIFEPFYEAVPPGVPGYRGIVPLSLYLSKLIIERHNGRIWFESEEGKGSTFYFSLPLAEIENGEPR